MRSPKPPEKKRDLPLFIRLSSEEMRIIEAAIKIHYGGVEGVKSRFAREAMLYRAKRIIEDYKKKQASDKR